MADNSWMWIMLLQQQEAQLAAIRAQEKAAQDAENARIKAEAQAAQQAQQKAAADARQRDAKAAQDAEAARQAALAGRPSPIAPQDAWSPVGGTYYGQGQSQNTSHDVGGAPGQPNQSGVPGAWSPSQGKVPGSVIGSQGNIGGGASALGPRPTVSFNPDASGLAGVFSGSVKPSGGAKPSGSYRVF